MGKGDFFFKMGSSFSILNDTREEYYVTHYDCQAALWGSLGALAGLTGSIAAVGVVTGIESSILHDFYISEIVTIHIHIISFLFRCRLNYVADIRQY